MWERRNKNYMIRVYLIIMLMLKKILNFFLITTRPRPDLSEQVNVDIQWISP